MPDKSYHSNANDDFLKFLTPGLPAAQCLPRRRWTVREIKLVNDPEAKCVITVKGRDPMGIAARIANILNAPRPKLEPLPRGLIGRDALG